ncbi:MAG: hypothetical protein HY872_02950 [Chloroflexi bacterium]|nr:hypothetical protein [Chloroflexota bacterium]
MEETKAGRSGGVNFSASEAVNVGRDVVGRDIIYNVQGVDPGVLKDLEERLNNFLAQFVVLHRQLEEWKDLHNVLQDLQVRFTTCRSYALELGRRDEDEGGVLGRLANASGRRAQRVERLLYDLSLNWQQCKITLDQLRRFTMGLRFTGPAYEPRAQTGPEPMKALDRLQLEIDGALHDGDRYNLADVIGEFAKQTDDYLYLADKALRDVAKEINQLPQQVRLTTRP